jgi:hypothetical protein
VRPDNLSSDNSSLGAGFSFVNSARSCFGTCSGSEEGKPTVLEIMEVKSGEETDGAMPYTARGLAEPISVYRRIDLRESSESIG